MRLFLLFIYSGILFSSCTTYRYATISGSNIELDERQEFVAENDTVRIVYNFYGSKGPVKLSIYNKLPVGLQIDWKRSAMVIGQASYSYYSPNLTVNGDVNTSAWTRRSASIDATITREEGLEFLPPGAVSHHTGPFIADTAFQNTAPLSIPGPPLVIGRSKVKASKASFTPNNSPLLFKSFLTLLTAGQEPQVFTTEHRFYVSEVLETAAVPFQVWSEPEQTGNKFFMKQRL